VSNGDANISELPFDMVEKFLSVYMKISLVFVISPSPLALSVCFLEVSPFHKMAAAYSVYSSVVRVKNVA
jgi:hypothetical protein